MNKTIGFIGSGNMGQAMINGLLESGIVDKEMVIASAKTEGTINQVSERYGIKVYSDNNELAKRSDYLILAVKPYMHQDVLEDIKGNLKKGAIVITVGAGITLDFLKNNLPEGTRYLKAMPNTPAMVGEGMTAIAVDQEFENEEMEEILSIFRTFGRVEIVEENKMDGVTAVAGSSPAYVYMLIEAMADAAVLQGLQRKQAYTFAAQAVLGAARMVLETGIHPGELKDKVCSPGGTTIEAVTTLEREGFRSAVMEAMKSCADKSRSMSK
ncbi:MAG: pyrroline-5-carboxylate reductase [Gudongella sp.]|nr:pyrroline-5-carboxylate reductase [Gudongella sp.]